MTDGNRKFLIFSLPGSRYALDLTQVAEVGDPPQIWPIPLAPPCFSGALNFHGDIVAVLDLAVFLGLAGPGSPGKIIVLHHEIASLALLVETVVRIVSGDDISFTPSHDGVFAAATLGLIDGEAVLIDLAALVHGAETAMQKSSK